MDKTKGTALSGRTARLRAALRENLKRRKAQARARAAAGERPQDVSRPAAEKPEKAR
jgi:hypothetical protein